MLRKNKMRKTNEIGFCELVLLHISEIKGWRKTLQVNYSSSPIAGIN